ncbi:BgTH12-07802 [Blumeria graminis f. sp. triticale]|uniref:BgTH12-07802 n=1 Tax=Blumeria graminis f. sp. triticale TaxID=1689686 RepID=A0A9W4DTR3_BLUGR|nr:BgTH12-07802 [Blumeria graminis f. sp. triticale]
MKFLSAVFPAAWAGILLLVPAVYADPHFDCGDFIGFTLSELTSRKGYDGFVTAEPGEPKGPNGEEYLSHRYRAMRSIIYTTSYLAQPINEYPYFRAFHRTTEVQEPFKFIEN